MQHVLRDIIFITTTLVLYYFFLPKGAILLWQVSIILSLFMVYVIVYLCHANCDKNSKRKARDLAQSIKEEDTRRLLEEENADIDDLDLAPGNLTMVERATLPLNVDTADEDKEQFIP